MITLLIVVAILWAYGAVVLAVIAGRSRWRDLGRTKVSLAEVLKVAAVIFILCPLFVYAARIDWYGESEG